MPEGGGSIAEETETAMFLAGMPEPDGGKVLRRTPERREPPLREVRQGSCCTPQIRAGMETDPR